MAASTLGKLYAFLVALFVTLITFQGLAFAASAAGVADANPLELFRPVYDAFAHGDYPYAGSLALVAAVAAARKYGPDVFRTEAGTASLLLLGSFGATLSTRLAGGVELTAEMTLDAAKIAFFAAGGYAAFKALVVVPVILPLLDKYPRIAAPLKMLAAMFQTGQSAHEPKAVRVIMPGDSSAELADKLAKAEAKAAGRPLELDAASKLSNAADDKPAQ